ncbi:MAG TPA: hypothetical protein VJH92_06135 [Candidatus Nanoarchaeia archaeon]|nr:hypothetical protein [Candidatus Nanoarchaeia archaeon]
MKKLVAVLVLLVLSLNTILAVPGSIWTTRDDCGNLTQNVNQFALGEKVYINGNNFASESHNWEIKGQPGGASCDPNTIIANGSYVVDASGEFCIQAYTISLDDCGVYKVDFGGKNDNYQVDLSAPSVPEFGTIVGILTMLGAVGVFFMIRQR